jgi:CMP-N-acetylneuraminic acid synthetase
VDFVFIYFQQTNIYIFPGTRLQQQRLYFIIAYLIVYEMSRNTIIKIYKKKKKFAMTKLEMDK